MEKKRYEMPVMKTVKFKNSGRLLYAASEVQVKDVDSDEVTWKDGGFDDDEGDN